MDLGEQDRVFNHGATDILSGQFSSVAGWVALTHRMVSNIFGLYQLDANSTLGLTCDNQKYLQILTNIPWDKITTGPEIDNIL